MPITRRTAVISLAAGPLAPIAAAARAKDGPPVARIEPVSETFFGRKVVDPYRWMENAKDAQWEPFMRGQDAHARAVLNAIPGRAQLAQRVAELSGGTALAYGVRSAGGRVFYQVRPAGADNFKLAVREGQAGDERILVDPTAMKSDDGKHVSLDWWYPSPDGRLVAYGLSPAGSENSVLHVMEVDTQRVLPERIAGTQYAGVSWLPDASGFFYWRVADPMRLREIDYYQKSQARLHRLGSDTKDDPLLMAAGKDPAVPMTDIESPYVMAPQVGNWALLLIAGGVRHENPLYVAPLADVLAGRAAWKRVCTIDDEVVDFAFDDQHLWLLTTKNAPNGRLLRTPLASASFADAVEVVPEQPHVVLEGTALARDGLYLQDMDGGYHGLRRLARDGTITSVTLPFEGSLDGLAATPAEDGAWFGGTGWLLPPSVFRVDAARARAEHVALVPPSPLDLSGYEAVRTIATARDGTRVPLSVVARKGLPRNGRNPTLVEAYGAYQVVYAPHFNPRLLALLERGGVYAVAHVRGGGEYGKRWWKAGQKATKPNTWRDLIDCCEHLLHERWASRATLTIQGGSAGGITVGRALTERPDLFAGVISNVGVSNALRAEFSQNGPGNIDEFGTVTERAGFEALLAMDATQHVKPGTRYPAVLLTCGMNDPRVEAWQAAKFAAHLQRAQRGLRAPNPVLLRVEFDAGHGMGSTRKQVDEERADEFAFVLWRAGRRSVG